MVTPNLEEKKKEWDFIRKSYADRYYRGCSAYEVFPDPFRLSLTPIEQNLWSDIRYLGLPFLPQFPSGGYFIDFADPEKMIAIEVDGKDFHSPEKDRTRQERLEAIGWTFYRIPGWMTMRTLEDYIVYDSDEETVSPDFNFGCSEGLLRQLRDEHYRPHRRSEMTRIFS